MTSYCLTSIILPSLNVQSPRRLQDRPFSNGLRAKPNVSGSPAAGKNARMRLIAASIRDFVKTR